MCGSTEETHRNLEVRAVSLPVYEPGLSGIRVIRMPMELQNTYVKCFACSYRHGDSAKICGYVREKKYTELLLKNNNSMGIY